MLGFNVLHCGKASWFRHIEASTVRFAVWALIVSGDNGLNDAAESEGLKFSPLQGLYC
jgi:hypothetical protein